MMKKIILSLICLSFVTYIVAQELAPCGTTMDEKSLEWLKKFRQNPVNYKSLEEIDYVPIQFHIVGTNEGEGYYTNRQIFRLMCDVNRQFEGVGMQFFLHNEPLYINNDDYYIHDFTGGYFMMAENNVPNAVNVYMVQDPAGNCGYFSPGVDGVAVSKNCAGENATTLTHELGHFFSLPHPFDGSQNEFNREYADGSNCATTADYFCDTPADYISDRWNCPYTGSLTDPLGNPIYPDGSLYMSYSNDACQNRFSPEQIQAMLANLYTVRTNLLINHTINIQHPGETFVLYPAQGANLVSANKVTLFWKEALLADSYYVEVRELGSTDPFFEATYTTETSLELSLAPNTSYRWVVRPLAEGFTCAEEVESTFTTSSTAIHVAEISTKLPTCQGANDGSIEFTVSGGTPPYTYEWFNGVTSTTNSAENLASDEYSVKVTDSNEKSTAFLLNLPEPSSVELETVQTDNFQATVSVSGGILPYEVSWSNGETTMNATQLPIGNNTVSITDGNGCTITKEVNITSIATVVNNISCTGVEDGSIAIALSNAIEPLTYAWATGETTSSLTGLAAGVYEVEVIDGAENMVSLTYEIEEPSPLDGDLSTAPSTASITMAGGTPPYTYVWPNNFSLEPTTTGLSIGDYNLLVLDSQNCSFEVGFSITEEVVEPPVGIHTPALQTLQIYPSLVTMNQPLTIAVELPKNQAITLSLLNSTGQLVKEQSTEPLQGKQTITFPTTNLTTGLYLLKIQLGQETITRKIVVSR